MKSRANKKSRRRKSRRSDSKFQMSSFQVLENRRMLATFTVTNLNDSGAGSLRDAITTANNVAGADTITFSPLFVTDQTITLASQLPTISDDLTITGSGANLLTIDAGNGADGEFLTQDGFRIFNIDDGEDGNQIEVNLSGLTLTGGDLALSNSGGAILNRENLTLTSSTIFGNSAPSGGGIANTAGGNATVIDTSIVRNGAITGGGIANLEEGTVNVTGTTITANSANNGGGIANLGEGTANVTGTTINGNFAFDNGGGIYNSGAAILSGSIVANSLGDDLFGVGFSGGFNLIEDGTGGLANTVTGDPLLGRLADNGGPTLTHALLPGSPAIDTGDPAAVAGVGSTPQFDQRGFARVQGGGIDIGAVETNVIPSQGLVVSTNSDVLDFEFSPGELSLREAIFLANDVEGADTITFSPLFDTAQTIAVASQLPTITDDLTITGSGDNLLTIDAGNGTDGQFGTGDGFRIFNLNTGSSVNQIDVTFSGLTLTGGDVPSTNFGLFSGSGGAILNFENLTLTDTSIRGNSAIDGGGINNIAGATVTVIGSTISGNSASIVGGGISNGGTATVISSTISGNSTSSGGGIANAEEGTATVTGSTISGNSASIGGGGISNGVEATLTVTSSTISGNSATSGGGIYNYLDRPATITNSIVANSTSGGDLFGTFSGGFNLIEDGSGGLANTITGDPLLGPLADNGGPTQTHALLPGSPAIDAGSKALAVDAAGDPLLTDQRGTGFDRIFAGTVDIGAFELQFLPGDVNQDGVINFSDIPSFISILQAGDFLAEADINGDGVVNFSDIPFFIDLLINQSS